MKLNPTLHKKLLAEAEEAKLQSLTKLASALEHALVPSEDSQSLYSLSEVRQDVYEGLWKLATSLLKYHDVTSLPTERLDVVLADLSIDFMEQVEQVIGKQDQIGPFEPKVPGQE